MVFVREDQTYPDFKVRHALRVASWFYPNWSAELADALLADFGLPAGRAVKKLSRGMRSALGIVIGLAARADVTLFDEPYAGLDAVARQIFYDRLLADYAEHPRTILLSTHLIDEAAGLLERVVVIDRGRIVLTADADDLRGVATAVSGPVLAVDEFTAGPGGLGPAAGGLAGLGRRRRRARRGRPAAGPVAAAGSDAADVAATGRAGRRAAGRRPGKDKRMRTWRDVARYHLVMPWVVVGLPWAIMAFSFVVNLVIFSIVPAESPPTL